MQNCPYYISQPSSCQVSVIKRNPQCSPKDQQQVLSINKVSYSQGSAAARQQVNHSDALTQMFLRGIAIIASGFDFQLILALYVQA